MNWDLYRVFLSIIRTGSISKAADHLGMSEPTVSRRLNQLESDLGVPLFWRGAQGLSPTTDALTILEQIEAIDGALLAVQNTYHNEGAPRERVVRVSAPPGLVDRWLSAKLPPFLAENPGYGVEIDSASEQVDLAHDQTDIVFRVGEPGDGDLVGTNVGKITFGIYCHIALLERFNIKEISLESLRELPMSLPKVTNNQLRRSRIEKTKISFLPDLRKYNVAITSDSWQMMMSAVEAGTHAGFFPIAYCENLSAPRQPFNAQPIAIYADLWILRKPEARLRPHVMAMFRYLRQELMNSRDWFQRT